MLNLGVELKRAMPTRRQFLTAALPLGLPIGLVFGMRRNVMSTAIPSAPTRAEPTPAEVKLRELDAIYPAPELHWVGNGFRVAGYFSSIADAARKLDPFLLLDYHPEYNYSPTTQRRGVGVHPHRGFETVTFAFQGSVAHHDSSGGGGVIGPGDVQWMTAASGILHKEYHEDNYARSGGPFQMVQLWVNLPRANKMDPARYQPLLAAEMGVVTLPNGAGSLRVIAGQYDGVNGPAKTFSPINIYDAELAAGGKLELGFPEKETVALLIMKGDVSINGKSTASTNDFVLFRRAGERILVEAESDAQVLVLNGVPLDEPVVQYGPFVMNTPQEIRQAMVDFNNGKFGYLED
jgi:quercetin 2,3-dioxygenase